MYKLIIACVMLHTVTYASTLTWNNGTGVAITITDGSYTMIVLPGVTKYPITSTTSNYFYHAGFTVDMNTDWYRQDLTGAEGPLVEREELESATSWFFRGFASIFCVGLLALGASWARNVMVGSAPE